MRCLVAFTILFLAPAYESLAEEPKPEKHKEALQGRWVPVKQVFGGKEDPESDWIQKAWDFKGDKVTITLKGVGGRADNDVNYTLTLDPSKNPCHFDLAAPNPKFGFIGLYKLEGDTLTVVWNAGREKRPEKLETTKKDVYTLIVFKRDKAK